MLLSYVCDFKFKHWKMRHNLHPKIKGFTELVTINGELKAWHFQQRLIFLVLS